MRVTVPLVHTKFGRSQPGRYVYQTTYSASGYGKTVRAVVPSRSHEGGESWDSWDVFEFGPHGMQESWGWGGKKGYALVVSLQSDRVVWWGDWVDWVG